MAKNKVKYIKPGRMAQQVPEYEKLRREKNLFNNMRIQAMGFQKMADSLVDSYKKRKAKNTKEARAMNGDDEYQPSGDEDNEDKDNDDSYSDEEGLVINNFIVYSRHTNISLVINFISHGCFTTDIHSCPRVTGSFPYPRACPKFGGSSYSYPRVTG